MQSRQTHRETIAAIATPPGEGGIAIVRVTGPEARTIAAQIFRPQSGRDPAAFPGYSVHYGRFAEPGSREIADDGLLTLFRAPHSYTGEDAIELSCHGGRITAERVLNLTLAAGARLALPGEFTQRAFLNGRIDLAQAEAVADLIRAKTGAAQRLARRQLDGAVSQAMAAMRDELIGILAAIEVTIDFSEEVGELDYDALLPRLQNLRRETETLLATAEQGRILREGLRVIIAGRPNVGKSSLLNALLRAERAIVTPIAGTTRDLVEETANIGGLPVVLTDTAGLRETNDPVERIGVLRAEEAASLADAILLVLDAAAGLTPEDSTIAARLAKQSEIRCIWVWNKCDTLAIEQAAALSLQTGSLPFAPAAIVQVSAQTGAGLDALEAVLVQVAGGENGGSDSVIVSNARHRQALETAHRSLREAEQTAAQRLPGDFIAIDVRGALDAIGQITGETVTEDIIHRIFRDFCVGK